MQKELITHFSYWLFCKPSGLKKHVPDPRNFQTGIFNWGAYQPKSTVKLIPTKSVKDQGSKNTCQFNATTVQKEPDEGMELSVRSIVAWGVKNGFVSGNGFSNLESGQKALKNWGILEKNAIPEDIDDWNAYANVDVGRFAADAGNHKTSSYWQVSSRNDILKLLDDNRIIVTGIEWFTGFNQGGGFGYPWIINKKIGYSIGGHALAIKGYIYNYKGLTAENKIITGAGGTNVFVIQNSYGPGWGASVVDDKGVVHRGLFFIDMAYFINNNWGCYVNLDLSIDIGAFINQYDGKNVKGSGPTIYFIQKGQKKPYPDEVSYLAFNVQDKEIKSYSLVKDDILAKIPTGDIMDITKSLYWDMLQGIQGNEERIKKLIEILHQ